jgi:hypothetical protein
MDPTTAGRRRLSAPVVAGIAGVAIAGAAAVAVPALASNEPAGAPAMRPVSSTKFTGDAYGSRGDMFVLTDAGWLQRYDRWGAGKLRLNVAITGLAADERLIGIDTRPANGQLYGVGSTSRLYVVDPATGAASPIGTAPFTTALSGNRFGVDFNPTVDRLRIVSDTGQNLRIDPTTGAVAGVDTNLSYDGGGPPSVTAAAYTNSVAGATSTALYDIDTARDTLVLQGTKPGVTPAVSPNTGKLFPVGKLGIDVDGLNGFEIVGAAQGTAFKESDYTALAAVKVKGDQKTSLVRIDLRTGKATRKAKLNVGVAGLTASAGTPVTCVRHHQRQPARALRSGVVEGPLAHADHRSGDGREDPRHRRAAGQRAAVPRWQHQPRLHGQHRDRRGDRRRHRAVQPGAQRHGRCRLQPDGRPAAHRHIDGTEPADQP